MPERSLFPVPEVHPYRTNGDAPPPIPSLKELARQIQQAHEELRQLLAKTTERAWHMGQLLLDAKSRMPHGEWLGWLEKNCPFAARTAQRYMKLTENFPDLETCKNDKMSFLLCSQAQQELCKGDMPPQPESEPLSPEEQAQIRSYVQENALEGICELLQADRLSLEDAHRLARLDDCIQRRLVTVLGNLDAKPDARMVTALITEATGEEKQADDGPVRDMLEQEVPRKLRPIFSDTVVLDFVKELQAFFRTVKRNRQLFYFFHRAEVWQAIGKLEELIEESLPHSLCRICHGRGRAKGEECRRCLGQGYVSRAIYTSEQEKSEPVWEVLQ